MSKTYNQLLYEIPFSRDMDGLPFTAQFIILAVCRYLRHSPPYKDMFAAGTRVNVYDLFKLILKSYNLPREVIRPLLDLGVIEIPQKGFVYLTGMNELLEDYVPSKDASTPIQSHVLLLNADPEKYTHNPSFRQKLMIAKDIHGKLLKAFPGNKTILTVKAMSWVQVVDAMIRLDNRKPEDIIKVFDFAHNDPFWRANILSITSVREKFDTLYAKLSTKDYINKPVIKKPTYLDKEER